MQKKKTGSKQAHLVTAEAWIGLPGAILLAVLIALFTFYLYDTLNFAHLYYMLDTDQARSALVARSLAHGIGYKTPLLPDAMIDYYAQLGKLNVDGLWENSDRFPMTIFGIFLLFKLFGSTHFIIGIALFGFLFFVGTCVLVYLLARRLTGSAAIALFAVVLMGVTGDITETIVYKGADDMFYMTLCLWAYLSWRDRLFAKLDLRALLLGLFIGLAFLCRPNMAAFFILGMGIDALWALSKKEARFGSVFQTGLLSFLGFAATIAPFGLYSYQIWGKPFFSANSLYQFSFYTPYQMDTDPWWKLHSPVGKIANFDLFLQDPAPFLANTAKFITVNVKGLVSAYIFPLCGVAYMCFTRTLDKSIRRLRPAFILLGTLFLFNLLALGPFVEANYAAAYLIYIFPAFLILAADGFARLFSVFVKTLAEHLHKTFLIKPFLRYIEKPLKIIVHEFLLMGAASVTALYFMRTYFPFIHHFGIEGTGLGLFAMRIAMIVVAMVALAFLLALFVRARNAGMRLAAFWVWAGFLFLALSAATPNAGMKESEIAALPKVTPALQKLVAVTNEKSIVLSFNGAYALPWLTGRRALGLPEYPAYIYEMIVKDGLPVDAVYLDGAMNWFLHSNARIWAPSYVSYPLIGRLAAPIPGFDLVDYRVENDAYPRYNVDPFPREIALYKRIPGFDFKRMMEPPESYSADNPADRIHFVSGFGETGSLDGKKVVLMSDDVRLRFADRPERLRPWADADITFFATADKKPRAIVLDAYMLGKTQLSAYLNLDLDIYDRATDRAGKKVDETLIDGPGWKQIRIALPADKIKDGLNKIGFRASILQGVSVCNTQTNAETRAIVEKMDPRTCFKIDGNALPSGVLAGMDPVELQSDFGKLQESVTQASGLMLLRKVSFAY